MSVKLIKTIDEQGAFYVLSGKNLPENYVLSDKNCQAIERGYDVYDLAKENYHKFWSVVDESEMLNHTFGYVEGFQKALELMGDKKFSEEDIRKAMDMITHVENWDGERGFGQKYTEDEIIQSLQQNEWEVEIIMEEVVIGDKYTPEPKPKLDADGCLILKRL